MRYWVPRDTLLIHRATDGLVVYCKNSKQTVLLSGVGHRVLEILLRHETQLTTDGLASMVGAEFGLEQVAQTLGQLAATQMIRSA